MQRTVEQRHSPKRRTSARRHPPAKVFGFTARQRPFIIVLVANWIFSIAFFLGMKLVWHWQPEDWGIADRIALVLKDAVFALLPGVIGICIVAAQRLNPSMFVGQTPKANSAVDINNRFILNTFEQFTAYFVANAGLAMYCPPEEARSLPLLTMLFVMGRILFWIGYHRNPYLRAFGFGITFYPTVAAFAWLMLIMIFGIRIPL
ncbi:MAG: MAPEG family protein [Methyloceanibacter sp.]